MAPSFSCLGRFHELAPDLRQRLRSGATAFSNAPLSARPPSCLTTGTTPEQIPFTAASLYLRLSGAALWALIAR